MTAAILSVALIGCEIGFYFIGEVLEGETDITIVLDWSSPTQSLELYLTGPEEGGTANFTTVRTGDITVYDDIRDAYYAPLAMYTGSHPEPGTYRFTVDGSNTAGGYQNVVTYESNPEDPTARIIKVDTIPVQFDAAISRSTIPSSFNGILGDLESSTALAWLGVMEVYVRSTTGPLTDAGNVVVRIYDQQDQEIATIPLNQSIGNPGITGMSVVRIPFFHADRATAEDGPYYQYLLDQQVILDETDVRSIAETGDVLVASSFGRPQ